MTSELSKYYPLSVDRFNRMTAVDQSGALYKHTFNSNPMPAVSDLARMPTILQTLLSTALMERWDMCSTDRDTVHQFLNLTSDVVSDPHVWSRPDVLNKIVLELFANASIGVFWHHYRWVNSGRRIYDLSPELAETFASMEMNYPVEALKLPYPEFFVTSGTGEVIHNEQTGEHQLAGMYVSDIQRLPVKNDGERRVELDLLCPDGISRTGMVFLDDLCVEQQLDLALVGWPHDRADVGNDAIFRTNVPLKDGMTIEQSLQRDYNWRRQGCTTSASQKNADTLIQRWSRIVVNLLIYLASIEPDVETRWAMPHHLCEKADKIENKKQRDRFVHKNCHGIKVVYVGHTEFTGTHASPVGHIRRGHPRWQACGPKWSQHKMVWIKPAWIRGRDGEQPAHITDVTEGAPDESPTDVAVAKGPSAA